jgi:hypothetical protein
LRRCVVILLVACSAKTTSAPPKPTFDSSVEEAPARTLEQACSDYAFLACDGFETCPSMLHWQFPDRKACYAGLRARCVRNGTAPGVLNPTARIDGCVAATRLLGCDRRWRELWSCATAPGVAGTLADGAPCWSHAQCASGGCLSELPFTRACGKCGGYPRVGDPCMGDFPRCTGTSAIEAGPLLRCDLDVGQCVTAPPPAPFTMTFAQRAEACARWGEPDDVRPRCGGGLYCSVDHICVPTIALGESCKVAAGEYLACGWDALCKDLVCTAISEMCR